MQVFEVETVVEAIVGAAHGGILIERLERAAFHRTGNLSRSAAFPGDDVDDTADRVRPIQTALRTAQDFNAFNILRQELTEIERGIRAARITDIDAIDQHLDVIGIGPAYEHRSQTTRATRLHQIQ